MTIDAIRRGALEYIENEIQPHLSPAQSGLVGAYALLVARNLPSMVEKYKDHPLVALTGVVAPNGDIDVDSLAEVVRAKYFPTSGSSYTLNIPMLPSIKVGENDLTKLLQYIKAQA